jgi:hypothetical protein
MWTGLGYSNIKKARLKSWALILNYLLFKDAKYRVSTLLFFVETRHFASPCMRFFALGIRADTGLVPKACRRMSG